MITSKDLEALNERLTGSDPKEIIREAIELWPNIAISFSGAEDVALIEMASKLATTPAIFTLDTGRLHTETYEFIESVRRHYELPIETLHPDPTRLSRLTRDKGLFSFYDDGHEECCSIRKVEPLRGKLATVDAWITGQRRDQSPTRAEVPVIQLDNSFSTPEHPLVKINPLANWSSEEVWNYIRMFDVPYNELHDNGFISIGCEPCTRPVGPNQHEREGRWWWEEATIKECGLHRGNVED
ncbi:MAG: phosphoadenosine phosphosulfate reductase [Pseudohongiella sp.]|nr:MAG: phosphoadenosine phosphosulfate reductase [Pseudohongiella sp.]